MMAQLDRTLADYGVFDYLSPQLMNILGYLVIAIFCLMALSVIWKTLVFLCKAGLVVSAGAILLYLSTSTPSTLSATLRDNVASNQAWASIENTVSSLRDEIAHYELRVEFKRK